MLTTNPLPENFYDRLKRLTAMVAEKFTDEGDEGSSPVNVYAPDYIDSNYPWLYLHFGYDGPLSLHALKEIERIYQEFTAVEGGSLERVHLARRGPGFTVRLMYVDDKKKAPVETQELPNSDSAGES
jgi:hypothetical protein